MCGIYGYKGKGCTAEVLFEGLKRLEYRGYDSAGIAVVTGKGISSLKRVGNLSELINAYNRLNDERKKDLGYGCGIGHTRWATHGGVTERNSHPHLSYDGKVAIVHNGIIENYESLKDELHANGIDCISDTDSEVIAHFIALYMEETGDFAKATVACIKKLEGSWAIAAISKTEDKIIAVKKGSPLVIGAKGKEFFVSSDIPTLNSVCSSVYLLGEDEMCEVSEDAEFYSVRDEVERIYKEPISLSGSEKKEKNTVNGSYMEKEILEIPYSLKATHAEIQTSHVRIQKLIEKTDHILFVGCGTAFHACMYGAQTFESRLNIPCKSVIASEFVYSHLALNEKTLCFFISQSGETADTLKALRKAKAYGAETVAVTNVENSSICFETENVIITRAGEERAVASTKAYNAQLAALSGILDKAKPGRCSGVREIIAAIEEILTGRDEIYKIASVLRKNECLFYIGRGLDYITAREGALKLKEISYLYCEALSGGELKHGTLALIHKGVKVVAIATQRNTVDKMRLAIEETRARGAEVITVSTFESLRNVSDIFIKLPGLSDEAAPQAAVVPLQLLAYATARRFGYNPDMPRNLAKSVTVE